MPLSLFTALVRRKLRKNKGIPKTAEREICSENVRMDHTQGLYGRAV